MATWMLLTVAGDQQRFVAMMDLGKDRRPTLSLFQLTVDELACSPSSCRVVRQLQSPSASSPVR